jgi:hypothetical protein
MFYKAWAPAATTHAALSSLVRGPVDNVIRRGGTAEVIGSAREGIEQALRSVFSATCGDEIASRFGIRRAEVPERQIVPIHSTRRSELW